MTSPRVPYLTSRLQGFGTSVFAEMTQLAREHQAVNLGQGFPDFEAPDFVKKAAIRAIERGDNQYARSAGLPELAKAIATHQKRFYGLDYEPLSEVTVYAGATEAICAAIQSLCEVGDEVVTFEPTYDSYRASIAMAGAVAKLVRLRAPSFDYDPNELERAITPKTRVLLLNSPHNPTGKVFSKPELEHIAALCHEHDLIAVTDEVYEHLVFEGQHVPLATLPGMRKRTVTISSSGKTFSTTGWKIGWSCSSAELATALRGSHQFITFCNGTPFQHAIAEALTTTDEFYRRLLVDYRARRDRLCAGLEQVGFSPIVPAGTYFVCADIRPLGFDDDVAFCRELPERAGVAAIPTSAFCVDPEGMRHLARFAFCKSDEALDEGIRRLQAKIGELKATTTP